MHLSTTLLALLSASSALAAPVPPSDTRLEDIQCRCLSFATDAKPSVCTYMGAHHLDWPTAKSLADDHALKINFASRRTIANVLAIRKPLPASVLRVARAGEAAPLTEQELVHRENRIVCGLRDLVEGLGSADEEMGNECRFVGYVVAGFVLLVAGCVLAEYVWSRFFSHGSIKLDGDEKALMAEHAAEEESGEHVPAGVS